MTDDKIIWLDGNAYKREIYEGEHGKKCPDCGTPEGKCHKRGCDREKCPKCGKQLNICDC